MAANPETRLDELGIELPANAGPGRRLRPRDAYG